MVNTTVVIVSERASSENMRVFVHQLRQLGYDPRVFQHITCEFTRKLPLPIVVLIDVVKRDLPSVVNLPTAIRAIWEYTPLVLLTDEREVDRLRFDARVQDFLTLPISLPLLDTRIRFFLTRANASLADGDRIELSGLSVNHATRTVTVNQRPLQLTYKEYELLHFFITHPRRVYTRAELLATVWDQDNAGDTRTVDIHIQRLRAKLGPRIGKMIRTVRNVGYRFE